jgi:hypothetical protein
MIEHNTLEDTKVRLRTSAPNQAPDFVGQTHFEVTQDGNCVRVATETDNLSDWKVCGFTPLGYTGNPDGHLTSRCVLDLCVDVVNNVLYYAPTANSTLWLALSTNSGGNPNPGTLLTYQTPGDENGLFYWLGANQGAQAWSNPVPSIVNVLISAPEPTKSPANGLTNRTIEPEWYTNNIPNQTITFDLGVNRIALSRYTLRHDQEVGFHLRNWKIRGSNDGTNWADLDTQVNNTTISDSNPWFISSALSNSTMFRYIQLQLTGPDSSGSHYILLSEVEFYGLALSGA